MLLYALIEFQFWGKDHKEFWYIKVVGILLGLTLMRYYPNTG